MSIFVCIAVFCTAVKPCLLNARLLGSFSGAEASGEACPGISLFSEVQGIIFISIY